MDKGQAATVEPGTGFSDTGRATNINNYGWLGERL